EFPLSTAEGVALMCLAEALLRIPDPAVADRLIRDVLDPIAWTEHVGHSDSLLVNTASWGLAQTGRWLSATGQLHGDVTSWLNRLSGKLGAAILRRALRRTMLYMANQFVLGETLESALQRGRPDWAEGVTHSFDMLGEAALTASDSDRYWRSYRHAVETVAAAAPPSLRPGVSIKLSALHPRYCAQQGERLERELLPPLCALIESAASRDVDITLDAEEADRLELSLQLFEKAMRRLSPDARDHLGLVVQAYGKRAWPVLHWLRQLALELGIRIKVRLVKGAYWGSEIKKAQQRGLGGYPVFTSKVATDISYLACARFLLNQPDALFPQFATHNALTVAAIVQMQPDLARCEFQ